MRFTAALIAVSASFAAAQSFTTSTLASATTSSSTCAAKNILDACLSIEQPKLSGCAANDWECMCTGAQSLLTCYNNCPSDPGQFGAQQTMTSYCNAAKAYATTSTSSASLPTGSHIAANPSATPDASASTVPTSSSMSASPVETTGAASHMIIPAGGVLGLVLGLAVLA